MKKIIPIDKIDIEFNPVGENRLEPGEWISDGHCAISQQYIKDYVDTSVMLADTKMRLAKQSVILNLLPIDKSDISIVGAHLDSKSIYAFVADQKTVYIFSGLYLTFLLKSIKYDSVKIDKWHRYLYLYSGIIPTAILTGLSVTINVIDDFGEGLFPCSIDKFNSIFEIDADAERQIIKFVVCQHCNGTYMPGKILPFDSEDCEKIDICKDCAMEIIRDEEMEKAEDEICWRINHLKYD